MKRNAVVRVEQTPEELAKIMEQNRKMRKLWQEAAEDDWRGPVKVEEGWQEKARAELDQYVKEQQKRGARSSNKAAALTDQ